MKLKVDQEKCIGCGACVAIAPENFDFDDEGLSKVINDEVTEKAKSAEEACPVYAISIETESDKIVQFPSNTEDNDDSKCAECKCNHNVNCVEETQEKEAA